MDPDFWLSRWRDGRTGFHQDRVTPLLPRHWPALGLAPGSRVLVPLCGKSIDMRWLAEQGHPVLGVELSALAVEQFFEEQKLTPKVRTSALGTHYVADGIELICGDIFALDPATLAGCDAVFDRAALVALPAAMRARYVDHVYGGLPGSYRGLLVSLDYPQEQMDGPPFCVDDAEIQAVFATHSRATLVQRSDTLAKDPKFANSGVTRLDTLVYRLDGDG